jgi:phosphomannomutase
MEKLNSFKAYDIRGKIPDELDAELAYKIGVGLAKLINPEKVVVGHDIRYSSEALNDAVNKGLTDHGVDVIDIGLCGTEMIYYATPAFDADGGIMITASHNPPEYNGMKFVGKGSVPIGYDTGLNEIEQMILNNDLIIHNLEPGDVSHDNIMGGFLVHLKKFYDPSKINPFQVVVNAGNGCAGLVLDAIESDLPIQMIKLFNEPNSDFPNGVPNPLIPGNRRPTIDAVIKNKANLGVAWDGDFDRCFFFDEKGNFIEGYYIVGLLAKSILKKHPGSKIVHDPRLVWNTIDIVKQSGGEPVVSKSGHAFIKQKMREVNAIYGGEMSAHHYFRDNAYSDSGMIPFLLVMQLMSEEEKPLSQLVEEMIDAYPCSGEINSEIENPGEKLKEVQKKYSDGKADYLDGLSVEYEDWRFNLRMSNTEPIIRLNVESRGNKELMEEKTAELLKVIRG